MLFTLVIPQPAGPTGEKAPVLKHFLVALGKGRREQKELLPRTLVDHLLHDLGSGLAPLASGLQIF